MKPWKIILSVAAVMLLLGILAMALPPVRERVLWRVDQARIRLQYALFPPEENVFRPGEQNEPDAQVVAAVNATMTQIAAAITATPSPSPTTTETPLPPDVPTATPTPTPTPLPVSASITNVPYVDQHYGFNNCAPANLTMALHFWNWTGTREYVTAALKPFEKDKNVMPYEMADFVNTMTGLRAVQRFGGTNEVLKGLIAAGFPVVVERGVYLRDLSGKISWMGHYQFVHGYDDATSVWQVKDSFEDGGENFRVSYEDMTRGWRSFNYAFIVVYPVEREAEVYSALGPYADETQANTIAARIASDEIFTTEGQDKFFAYYNRGTSLVWLQDYTGAAAVYDEAFRLYADLPAENRPWRATWYQTGPYFAYYYSGRHNDVISLADKTISSASEPYLEENFYWRARSKAALGDTAGAIEDLRQSLAYHPNFDPAVAFLSELGATP